MVVTLDVRYESEKLRGRPIGEESVDGTCCHAPFAVVDSAIESTAGESCESIIWLSRCVGGSGVMFRNFLIQAHPLQRPERSFECSKRSVRCPRSLLVMRTRVEQIVVLESRWNITEVDVIVATSLI